MFSQDDIDAVLREAEDAVNDLAVDVGEAVAPATTASAAQPSAPTAVVAPVITHAGPAPSTASAQRKQRVQRILGLKVPLIVRLASRSMSVNEIMKMGPGTILEFDRTVHQVLDLMINNCTIGGGVAVKVNEHFGLRINRIRNVQQRIDSLGAGS